MWIPRGIEALLRSRASQRPVVVLTGARQTGKTALVRRLFPGHEYVSLDLPSEAEQAEHDPRGFLTRHPPPLVVDEVQYAPGLFRHLKAYVDAHRSQRGRFILTGSQKFVLMKRVSESLAGRADVLELEGLTWAEIRSLHPRPDVEEVVVRGLFPELWADRSIDAAAFHRSYVATYLERDVRQLRGVGSLRDYERFLRACALRSAQLLNRADLSRDVGIAPSTAGEWLSILQASGQVALLEPWFSNRGKSLVKTPKLYLCDPGLCAMLVGVPDVRALLSSPVAGALWETFVFGEIRRTLLNRQGTWDLQFWRDRTREADFLRHLGGRFDLADAKWSEHPAESDAAALLQVARELPKDRVRSMALLCRTPNAYPLRPGVRAIPPEDVEQWLG